MVDKYIPNGEPLMAYEREVLEILQEECAEVIQAASKLLRFGKENRPPERDVPNTVVLAHEIGDLEYMIQLVIGDGIVQSGDVEDGKQRKREQLRTYMQHERRA